MPENEDSILVIEDDPDQQTLISHHLKRMGLQSHCVANAQEALLFLEENIPQMIVLDLLLPDKPGLLVLREIKENPKTEHIPTLISTAMADDEITVLALSNGATDIITKPYSFAQLLPRINRAAEIADYQKKLKIANLKLEKEKQGLSRYFSPDVAERILAEEIEPELGGKYVRSTILFADIRGSTSLAEELSAKNFVNLLNTLFGDIFDIIFGAGGSVNKILGDGILATFGVPMAIEEAEKTAVEVARDIQEHIKIFNDYKPTYLKKDLYMGIGIATGDVFAGNIGSSRLIEYTVIGDAVNLAARLQGLTKRFDTSILMDEYTYEKLSTEELQKNITALGKIQVRGKALALSVYSFGSSV